MSFCPRCFRRPFSSPRAGARAKPPDWVLRVLATAAQRLAWVLCEERLQRLQSTGELGEKCRERLQQECEGIENGGKWRRFSSKWFSHRSMETQPEPFEFNTSLQFPKDRASSISAVAAFLSGTWPTWTPPLRRDGFRLDDLGRLLDEDAPSLDEEPDAPPPAQPAAASAEAQRRIASSIVCWQGIWKVLMIWGRRRAVFPFLFGTI